jgi:hypothetical protein
MAVLFYNTAGQPLISTTPTDHTHASSGTGQGGQLTSPLVNEAVAMTATATQLNDVANKITKATLTEQGDIIYASAASTPAALAHSTLGELLVSGGHGANPFWNNTGNVLMRLPMLEIYMSLSSDGQSTITGTGTLIGGNFAATVGTGATSGGTSEWAWWVATWHAYGAAGSRHRTFFLFNTSDTVTTYMEFWVGYFADRTTFPTTTSNHYGIKLVSTTASNAVLSASNGAGAAETATQLVASVGQYADYFILLEYGADDIKYYYSTDGITWTLGATHTTNRPNSLSLYPAIAIKNSSNSNRAVKQEGWRVVLGGF